MFKQASIYQFEGAPFTFFDVERAMENAQFAPCAPTQERSVGWVAPRGIENAAMLESIGGHWIARFAIETRSVPAEAIERATKARVAKLEEATGRKPGRKELREIKAEIKLELLPHAFPKRVDIGVWIDHAVGRIVMDTATASRADDVTAALCQALPEGVKLAGVTTRQSPQMAMSAWLHEQSAPGPFALGRSCELRASDESGAIVRYDDHALEIDEIRAHIRSGKLPTRLSLSFDGRVSFVLTDDMALKKIEFLDAVFDGKDERDDAFDADVAIFTGEFTNLLPDLLQALS